MKRKFRSKLILFLLAVLSLFIFGGCTLGESLDDYKAQYGLSVQVSYYANGGKFENNKTKKEIWYKADSKALSIGETTATVSGSVAIKRDQYVFAGWYHIVEANGELVYEDKEAGTYKLGEPVDFTQSLPEGTVWNIAAKWTTASKVIVQLVCDQGTTLVNAKDPTKNYTNGSVIREITYGSTGKAIKPTGDPVTAKDASHTFVDYYTDAACTTPVKWNLSKVDQDVIIYAKYVTGQWNIVKDTLSAATMFSNVDATQKYWIANDIDYKGNSISAMSTMNFEIQGNGHKISNIKVNKAQIEINAKVALFGAIESTATIENLVLENVTVSYSAKTNQVSCATYLVFASLADGAKITNVSLQGEIKVTIDGPASTEASYSITNDLATNFCYGGYATDAAYTTASAGNGFKVLTTPVITVMANGSPIN